MGQPIDFVRCREAGRKCASIVVQEIDDTTKRAIVMIAGDILEEYHWQVEAQQRLDKIDESVSKQPIKMTDEALTALKESIAIWERRLAGERIPIGSSNCPLCTMFKEQVGSGCHGCPVFKKTGKHFCVGTPYILCDDHVGAYGFHPEEDHHCHQLILDEVNFLKSLLLEDGGYLRVLVSDATQK